MKIQYFLHSRPRSDSLCAGTAQPSVILNLVEEVAASIRPDTIGLVLDQCPQVRYAVRIDLGEEQQQDNMGEWCINSRTGLLFLF